MRKLALEGGIPLIRSPIRPLNTVSSAQVGAVSAFMVACRDGKATLSGYLAGSARGGSAVQRLEDVVAREFGVRHAIAVNSGTSALLAAILVCEHDEIVVPALGMSAVAAIPRILKRDLYFEDVDDNFCLYPTKRVGDILIAINLFGHPAKLHELRGLANSRRFWLIEDNAQAPWGMEDDTYTGCIGHIGAWSLNVHKPWQAGEGGFCTTNDNTLADKLRAVINHGEVSEKYPGLNLRMTEVTAVSALAQMSEAKHIVATRRKLAQDLSLADEQEGLTPPTERRGCTSSWYCYAMLAPDKKARDWAAKALQAEGVPVRAGYILIPEMKAFRDAEGDYTNAKSLNDRMLLIELCSIDPTEDQIKAMTEAIVYIGGII